MVKVKDKECCKKPAKIKAQGEWQLIFYLYQDEQIDYCHPEFIEGHGSNTDVSLVKIKGQILIK